MQPVGYNIVTTSVITVFHILCVKDLSSRLSFLDAILCLSTTSTEMYTQKCLGCIDNDIKCGYITFCLDSVFCINVVPAIVYDTNELYRHFP